MYSVKNIIQDYNSVVKVIDKDASTEEELMNIALEAGAEDIKTEEDGFEIITAMEDLDAVKTALEAKGLKPVSAEITMIPSNEVAVTDLETASKLERMIEALDDHDDTKNVYSNYNIADDILAQLEK